MKTGFWARACAMTAAAAAATTMMAATAPAAMAQADAEDGGLLIVRLTGARGWEASCDLMTDRGRAAEPTARGRGSRSSGSLIGRDVVSGSCTADAGARGPVEIVLDDRQGVFTCPFGPDAEDTCRRVVATGESVTFDVTLR